MSEPGTGTVQIRLLGGFEIRRDGQTLLDGSWSRKKEQALVKLLALQPGLSLNREQVLAGLWPELAPSAASTNLRKVRHALARALRDGGLDADLVTLSGETLALAPDVEVDARAFRAAAERSRAARTDGRLYEQAIELCRGELLPDDRFEEWTEPSRSELRALEHLLRIELAQLLESQGKLPEAADHLQQLVKADPVNEDVHRSLMRLYAQSGRRDRAAQQYNVCCEALQREIGAVPEEATELFYAQIREGRVPRSRPGTIASSTTFVGREQEIAELRDALDLARAGRGQIVLLAGEPGIGKTALAEELALYAQLRQARTVWGRCYEDESLPAFGP